MSGDDESSSKTVYEILSMLCKNDEVKQDLCNAKFVALQEDDRKRSSKKIVKELYKQILSTGLKKLLECLHRNTLRDVLAPKVDFEDKIPTIKSVLAKRIHDQIVDKHEENIKPFFEDINASKLKDLMDDLEMDIPDSEQDYSDAIVKQIEEIGFTNLLSSFNEKKLQEMADACNLSVQSGSKEILTDCIINQEDFKPSKKKKSKVEKASKKKPQIKAGITKIDLQTHFYRDELYEYCKDNDLNTSGSKKDYILRILAHVEGRSQPKILKKGAMLNKTKRKKKKENETEDEESTSSHQNKKKKTSSSDKSKTDESEEAGTEGASVAQSEQEEEEKKKGKKGKQGKQEGTATTTTEGR